MTSSTPFLDFLEDATDKETLHRIRREVMGETKTTKKTKKTKTKEKTIVKTKQKRKISPTLQGLVDDYYDLECGDRSTDFTCMISFLEESIAEFDFSTKKNSLRKWSDEALDILDGWLEKLQKLVMFAQRQDSEGLRGGMVKINAIARGYFLRVYKKQPRVGNDVFEYHWRRIIRGDRGIVLNLLDEKAKKQKYRLENKYEISWQHVTKTLRQYANNLELGDDEFTSVHATQLEMCVEANCGARKIGVLDPLIKFYTYDDYQKHLKSLSIVQPSVFRIGDDDSTIVVEKEDEALTMFKRENMIVQVGVAKDKNQRDNRFLEADDDRMIDGAVVVKPTTVFGAADTIRMVERVRRFFNLSLSTRPTGTKARVKMGALIGNRLTSKVLTADWPMLSSHAAKHGFAIGTHVMRKIYAVALASDELGYLANIHALTGRRLDAVVLQAHALRHAGSYATVQSYSNIHIKWGLPDKVLVKPDKALLRNLLSEMEFLREEYKEVKTMITTVAKESKQVQVAVDIDDSLTDVEKAIKKLRKRSIPAKWVSQSASDDDIRFVLHALKEAGAKKLTKTLVMQAKVGSSRYSAYKKRHSGDMKTTKTTVVVKRKRDDESGLLPPGTKVIVDQDTRVVNNKKKQKLIDQRNKQKVKRDAQRFGADNVVTDCDGDIQKSVEVQKGVVRDLCK